uniref:B box-type domain-containing protein n=1 Tax=Glycine max TaxID=3847 RepID=C6TJY7_SOYBN|nr:unknown [Glycine max]
MGYICDFCGDQRSMVYCRSDAACLCLSCDRNVHSANALSKRHSRTLLCERCNSQPAFVRCVEEKISLCQNCDWLGHGTSTSSSTHKRQAINCYSGCPSAAELSSIWSFVLEIAAISESTCEQELGLMSINENKCVGVPPEDQNVSGSDEVTDLPALNKSLVGASLMPESSSEPCILDQPAGPTNECLPKV